MPIADNTVLLMRESDRPLPFEIDADISVPGFSTAKDPVVSNEQTSSVFDVRNEEVEKFLQNKIKETSSELDSSESVENQECSCDFKDIIVTLHEQYKSNLSKEKSMLCHRNTSKFWELVFRQKIDFSTCDVSVIWAGEPGADGGGLLREFLLFAMENFPIGTHFFGTGNKLFFTALPTAIISKEYCILGQLCALAILHIGRGPTCFHLRLVEAVFTGRSSFPLESFDASDADGELKFKLESIKNGGNTHLIESNIFPTDGITKHVELFINYFCVISRYAAVQDFRRGFTSILKNYDKICCLKRFFVYSKPTVTLAEVRSIIRYVKRGETGSNLLSKEESAITEFEMLLLNLSPNVMISTSAIS